MDYIYVKSTKAGLEDFGSVYARVRTKDINRKYTLGFTISHHEWTKYRSMRFSSTCTMSSLGIRYGQFASILTQIKVALEEDFSPESAPEIIQAVKSRVINLTPSVGASKSKQRPRLMLTDYLEQYISDCQSGVRLKKGTSQMISAGYTRVLTILLGVLRRYEADRQRRLSLSDINMAFQHDFILWNRALGIRPNTIRNRLATISTIMRAAYEAKLTRCDAFMHSEFVTKEEEVDNIFLTPMQIDQLHRIDLSSAESVCRHIMESSLPESTRRRRLGQVTPLRAYELELTRDAFIIGCLTGQRYSDFMRISLADTMTLDNQPFVRIVQAKTGKRVVIPLDFRVQDLLVRHHGSLPPISNRRFNRNLRFLAELIGWTFTAPVDTRRTGRKGKTRFCDLIGTHTARRSFATNAYSAGVPLRSIMAVTGHSSEKTLRKYLKLQVEDKALLAAKDFAGIILREPVGPNR